MTDTLVVAAAQLNPVVGDIAGNLAKVRDARLQAARANANLLVLSELFIAGYPPEDLLLKQSFCENCREAIEVLAQETSDGGPAILIGTPWQELGKLHNSYCLLDDGVVQSVRHKVSLPNYGPFDEKRTFHSADLPRPVVFRGVSLGIPICEDIWSPQVVAHLAQQGAEFLIVPNASPFTLGKWQQRYQVAQMRVREVQIPLIYLNQLGGQDELVFDGASFALHADGSCAFQMPPFINLVSSSTWHCRAGVWRCDSGILIELPDENEAVYTACVLALRDYVLKTGFSSVLIGLSGGIDSALCAAIATDSLGADHVHCVMLPYTFTSQDSIEDSRACASALGVRYDIFPIHEPVVACNEILASFFEAEMNPITAENVQSRVRGLILMSISNQYGSMLITTGNKSELSVGYATLYGDMNGGYNPIKDIYKTDVFALARWRNINKPAIALGSSGAIIPERIFSKPPSAELKENQKDEDSLPPYHVLDSILRGLIEEDISVADLILCGHDAETVRWVQDRLYRMEYKRRQAAPGAKISSRCFNKDWRYPIAHHFKDKNAE